jgi:hypothetical protein
MGEAYIYQVNNGLYRDTVPNIELRMTIYQYALREGNFLTISFIIILSAWTLISGIIMYIDVFLMVCFGKNITDIFTKLKVSYSIKWVYFIGVLSYIVLMMYKSFPFDFLIPKSLGSYDEYDNFESTRDQIYYFLSVINLIFILSLIISLYGYNDLKKKNKNITDR